MHGSIWAVMATSFETDVSIFSCIKGAKMSLKAHSWTRWSSANPACDCLTVWGSSKYRRARGEELLPQLWSCWATRIYKQTGSTWRDPSYSQLSLSFPRNILKYNWYHGCGRPALRIWPSTPRFLPGPGFAVCERAGTTPFSCLRRGNEE